MRLRCDFISNPEVMEVPGEREPIKSLRSRVTGKRHQADESKKGLFFPL